MGVLQLFSIGFLTLAGGLALVALYYAGYLLRSFAAWTRKEDGPTDRLGFFIPFSFVVGLVAGSFAQGVYDVKPACEAAGQPLILCITSIAQG
ncbi:hypothetical protein ACT048_20650 [Ectopseudomonas khazarica]|uniref:hypothetical protein n=1 Tax=Ectopseudomonas khazarica TaxID=2502979 RepID=UPI0040335F51